MVPDRVHVEDVQWTPLHDEDRSRRLLLLLFGPNHDAGLAEKDARPPQRAAGYHVERGGGRGEVETDL
jgi:hypothetical protein